MACAMKHGQVYINYAYYKSTSVLLQMAFSDWLHYSLYPFYTILDSEKRSSVLVLTK